MRIILHVDMDSFFSSIEVRENPEYAGKPVIVGADPKGGKGRGVVSTCSYEARRHGVRSGMPISKAYRLIPHAVFLPVNYEFYRRVSQNIMAILQKYAYKFQQVSIDEAYLDVTGKVKDYKEAEKLAKKIKAEIKRKEKLTCSIGIGPNKLVAKIASDVNKPNGLTIVKPEEVSQFLSPLPVRCIPGVGPKTEAILKDKGIKTIGQLAEMDGQLLISEFGRWGYELHRLALGIDEREVRERKDQKSIGRETTFEHDTLEPSEIYNTLDELTKKVSEDIQRKRYLYRTITLKVRLEDFTTYTRSRTLEHHTSNLTTLSSIVRDLSREFLDKEKKIRLLGVRVSGLLKIGENQTSLADFS